MAENTNTKKEKTILGYARGYKKREENPKIEAKPEYDRKRPIRTGRYNNLILIILMLTVLIIVFFLIFTVYYFLHGSQIVDLAGVHVTGNIKKITSEMLGKQEESIPGYENWQSYRNKSLSLMYPEKWKLKDTGELSLKKYNERKAHGTFDYLVFSVTFREKNNPENKSLPEIAADSVKTAERLSETEENGVRLLKTGKVAMEGEMFSRYAFWKLDGKVLQAQAIYYRPGEYSTDEDFEKIIKSVRFDF